MKKNKANSLSQSISWLLFAILFFTLFLFPNNNLDLGWHMKNGQNFFKTGQIVIDNLYSSTLPDYIFPNHSWLYDVIIYPIFQQFSFLGLSVTNALIGLASIILIIKLFKIPSSNTVVYSNMNILSRHPIFVHGFKSQNLSLLAMIYTVSLGDKILNHKLNKKDWITAPIIFLLWANLHGQFIIGLGYIALIILGLFIDNSHPKKLRKNKLYIIKVLKFATLISLPTLINPIGINNHLDSFR